MTYENSDQKLSQVTRIYKSTCYQNFDGET